MTTKLLEFKNNKQELLRGIFITSEDVKNDYVVILLGGFERAATTEKKFKSLADELIKYGVCSFRFDAADCGLSDGDFYKITTQKLADDLFSSIEYLKNMGFSKFSICGHSLAGCVISLIIDKIGFEKIVLLAPALNQKELLRLWFVQKNNKDVEIDWFNYKNYINEEEYTKGIESDMLAKTHKLNFQFRHDNKDIDYSNKYDGFTQEKILLIHGTKDNSVPLESLNFEFKNKIIIENGDHDLERPGIIEQWIDKAVDFLI